MRKLDEKREVLYVIRAMDVLMSSGIGLEATIHSISQGGYGIISDDFKEMMDKVRSGGRSLEKELKSMMNKAETDLGWMVNSPIEGFNGLYGDEAKSAVIEALEKEEI